jgi:type VII secretion-associated serine protease mycosin
MQSSMPATHHRRRSGPAVLGLVIILAFQFVPGHAAASVANAACATQPAATIAALPWAQEHYDLAALAQVTNGAGVTVAVLDSGVDSTHPQLRNAVQAGQDMLNRASDGREDCVGHGTAVASLIAARPVPGVAFQGVAPGAGILPVRVSEQVQDDATVTGDGDIRDLAAGIRAAMASRPRPAVINLSISTAADHPELRSAVAAALDADIVVVAAVGNQHERGDPAPYPAAYEGVVGVGAIGPTGQRLPASQVGSYVDIVAPGDQVVAAAPGGGHLVFQGTSFAAPFVAATAALIRARYPELRRDDVARRLLATADPAPGARPSPAYGYGVLNPLRAVTEVVEPVAAAPAPVAPAEVRPVTPAAGATPAISTTLGAAALLVLAAAAVATLAAAVPLGRRRRWRPGQVDGPIQGTVEGTVEGRVDGPGSTVLATPRRPS